MVTVRQSKSIYANGVAFTGNLQKETLELKYGMTYNVVALYKYKCICSVPEQIHLNIQTRGEKT